MEDTQIIELFWQRDESAITETDNKYGRLCHYIAGNILRDSQDAEECVSDTYFRTWNLIPDLRPRRFPQFLSGITRNLALKKLEYLSASKRSPAALSSLEELGDCVSGRETPESELENHQIRLVLNGFLASLSPEKRNIFLWRYWYFIPLEEISLRTGCSQSKIKSLLYRCRQALRREFEKEGITI